MRATPGRCPARSCGVTGRGGLGEMLDGAYSVDALTVLGRKLHAPSLLWAPFRHQRRSSSRLNGVVDETLNPGSQDEQIDQTAVRRCAIWRRAGRGTGGE